MIKTAETIKWMLEIGIDAVVTETPIDCFCLPEALSEALPETTLPETAAKIIQPVTPPSIAVDHLDTLEKLHAALLALYPTNKTHPLVFADGNPQASVMIIGEAPNAEEAASGTPFAGATGTLLDKMLAAISLKRESVYISNILYWRASYNNTPPSPEEIDTALPFVKRHIELIHPKIIIALGGLASKTLLQTNTNIIRLRGQWHDYNSENLTAPIPMLTTYHPAFLLCSPAQKRDAWKDLLAIQQKIQEFPNG